MKRVIVLLKTTILLGLAVLCLVRTDLAAKGAAQGVQRCLTVIVPSLYGMMIVSAMLTKSGILSRFGNMGVWLFSQAAGYPVGIKLLSSRLELGQIDRRSACLLSGVCFGAGPAFVFGCVSSGLYGSDRAGALILASCVSANLLLTLALLPFLKGIPASGKAREPVRLSAESAMECIISAGHSMAAICLTVTAFSAAAQFLELLGITPVATKGLAAVSSRSQVVCEKLVYALWDVTAAAELPVGDFTLLPAISALVSFGGVCVFAQLKAVCTSRIPILPVVLLRIAASLLSFVICRLALPIVMLGETASAASLSLHKSPSPVPSVMLMLMTVYLYRKNSEFQQ